MASPHRALTGAEEGWWIILGKNVLTMEMPSRKKRGSADREGMQRVAVTEQDAWVRVRCCGEPWKQQLKDGEKDLLSF